MFSLPQQEVFKSLNWAFQLKIFFFLSFLQIKKKSDFILFFSNIVSLNKLFLLHI